MTPHKAQAIPAGGEPLTEAQLGLWTAQRLDPSNPIFNTAQSVEIDGPLDVAAFTAAVNGALAEADGLSVRLVDDPSGPRRTAAPPARLEVVELTVTTDPAGDALARMRADMTGPLDLAREAPVREQLFRLGPERFVWYQRIHHLVIDGFGTALLNARIAALYAARLSGGPGGDPFPSFAQVAEEARAYAASPRREADRAYWLARFTDRPEVPPLAPGTPVTAHHCHRLEKMLAPAGLAELARNAGVPWPDILTALVAAYVARHTGGAEAILGVPWMGRFGSAAARVPAMVMNVLPVRIAIDEDAPLAETLRAASLVLRDARRHGRYRGEQIRRDLGLIGGGRRLHGPLVNVLPFDAPFALPGVGTRLNVLGTGPVDDLTISFRGDAEGRGLRLEIEANPDLYTEGEVRAHLERLAAFVENALAASRLADVPTATAAETRWAIHEVNDTAHPVPRTTLAELIERRMKASADDAALLFGSRTVSYRELDLRSGNLAARLAASGIGRGDIVALAIPRSVELMVALLGILRAGAAYLPLDLDHPPARIASILDSANPKLVLTAGAIVPGARPSLAIDESGPPPEPPPFHPPGPRPEDPAYVIYTSGSTGAPKGVVIQHDAIVNRLEWMRAHYGIGADERILQKTPATFDVSVWEFFLPLIAGATLVVAPPGIHREPAPLAALIRAARITTLHFVPSMLAAFLAEPAAAGLTLRRVFCSGEELPAALRERFHATMDAELHNLYGPTEAAVDVTFWPAGRGDASRPVPIGFPVWNTAMHVLDARLRPLPPGVAGDLYIAGRQLAREYLGRPDLTAERFIPDPFAGAGARMYRTGDRALRRPDGAIVFLGRLDDQVKLRGLRIELGEIEAALAGSGLLSQVAVVVREDRPGERRIVAYAVADPAVDVEALRAHAAARLPDYMVPAAIVPLVALPVTANGKLDRAALPAPDLVHAEGRAPAPGTEARIAAIFADVLAIEGEIGAEDDFFLLGGHSLLAAELMLRIRQGWNRQIGLGALFEHSSVVRLAAYLDGLAGDAEPVTGLGSPVRLSIGAAGLAPLFCIHPAGGLSWCYGRLARALVPARTVLGIQAAGLDPAAPVPARLADMAAAYVAEIEAAQPVGSVHLAGWSVGGIIAHEAAVQLRERGRAVGVLAMLDAYPADCWRREPEPDADAALKALLHIAGYDPAALNGLPLTRTAVIGFLKAGGNPLGMLGDEALAGVIRVVGHNNRLVRGHHHRRFDGTLTHIRAALDHAGRDLVPGHWRPYAERIETHDVPALHGHLMGAEAVARIAPLLSGLMKATEDQAAPAGVSSTIT